MHIFLTSRIHKILGARKIPSARKIIGVKAAQKGALACVALALMMLFSACYKLPTPTKEALNVQIYRGKASLQGCAYVAEASGVINTKGYGVKLLDAIGGAENDLRNKAAKYGGNAVLVLHTESRYLGADYNFKVGLTGENTSNKIDEYIIYGEVYRCNF